MSVTALQTRLEARLRVAIIAPTIERRDVLTRIVTEAGHCIVDEVEADLILSDGESIIIGDRVTDNGVLPRDASAEQINAALYAVSVGLAVSMPMQSQLSELTERDTVTLLTPRELQILSAISEGSSNKEIARQLSISLHTVKFHVESLFRKLNVRSRAEAVARGLEQVRNIVDV